MEVFTVEEFQDRFDELIERVENGERLGIIDEDGKAVVMVRADEELIRIHTELNNEAS
jgi:PHD/YefM family antitoxin component YafN of YafNO toxin-antitoxin module